MVKLIDSSFCEKMIIFFLLTILFFGGIETPFVLVYTKGSDLIMTNPLLGATFFSCFLIVQETCTFFCGIFEVLGKILYNRYFDFVYIALVGEQTFLYSLLIQGSLFFIESIIFVYYHCEHQWFIFLEMVNLLDGEDLECLFFFIIFLWLPILLWERFIKDDSLFFVLSTFNSALLRNIIKYFFPISFSHYVLIIKHNMPLPTRMFSFKTQRLFFLILTSPSIYLGCKMWWGLF